MPKFSMFTPFGALAYSSNPSLVEKIYHANIANMNTKDGENFNLHPGSHIEASIYARSRVQAMARYHIARAYNNADPNKATESIPNLELELEIAPGPHDNLHTRRAVVAARTLLPNGATYINVTNALLALLGSGFVYYYVTRTAGVINFPAVGGDSPGNFVSPTTVIKNYLITSNISAVIGSPVAVGYVGFSPGTPVLQEGDVLTVDAQIYGQTERVTVTTPTASTFIGTFSKAHDANTFVSTAPYPFWRSTQRHALIIVTRAVAEDVEKRRQINELLARMLRGVSAWDIVPEDQSTPGTTAAIVATHAVLGRVGYAAVGSVTFP